MRFVKTLPDGERMIESFIPSVNRIEARANFMPREKSNVLTATEDRGRFETTEKRHIFYFKRA